MCEVKIRVERESTTPEAAGRGPRMMQSLFCWRGVGPYVKSSTIFLVPAQAGRMAGSQKESKSKKSHWGPALPESLKNETPEKN